MAGSVADSDAVVKLDDGHLTPWALQWKPTCTSIFCVHRPAATQKFMYIGGKR
uniref:Uncharacterized protein n=1 Tax=Castor canadensis TaxID=51338 RepID=A0A8C0VUN7_CASCN